MKLKVSQLETPLQEICFLLTVMMAIFTVVGGMIFLLTPVEELHTFFGILGTNFLFQIFQILGLSTFLISVTILYIGGSMTARCHHLVDIPRNYFFFISQVLFHLCFLILISSLFTVLQLHFQYLTLDRLQQGAGGVIGQTLGGILYDNFGLYGALTVLVCTALIVGIASGQIALVNILLWIRDQIQTSVSYVFSTIKIGFKYILFYLNSVTKKVGLDFYPKTSLISSLDNAQNENLQTTPQASFKKQYLKDIISDNKDVTDNENDIREDEYGKNQRQVSSSPPKRKNKKKTESIQKVQKESQKDQENQNEQDLSITLKKWAKAYKKPDINLLSPPQKKPKKTDNQSKNLEECLQNFQISGKVVNFHVGPTLTMYEFQPNSGVKVSKISNLSDDLALLLGAKSIRILTPIPGKMTVGIEIPNKDPYMVSFKQMVPPMQKGRKQLPLALGLDVYNQAIIQDLCEMPHLLVSGTTGSGKSVFINTAINSLLFNKSPKHLRFIMIDPKMIELNPYNRIPHLLYPVVTDLTEAKDILCWAEQEMDMRYQKFSDLHSRNIESFNETIKKDSKKTAQRRASKEFQWEWAELPYIVIVIDELADLMITQGKLVELPITRIAQKARACGIHMIMATQRPSAEIVTGLIKTNFPTRIAFKVSSSIDSRTILDSTGAEKLLGNGDMLFMQQGGQIERLQGCFLSEKDVKKVNDFLKS